MNKIISIVCFFILIFSGNALAGPFGTNMGDSLDKFPGADLLKNHAYIVDKMPKTHSLFNSYMLFIHPQTGLSLVKGVSRKFPNDRYGTSVRSAFAELRTQLDKIYGKSEFIDFLKPGALWKNSEDWVSAIQNKERLYYACWDESTGAHLKDDIIEINIGVISPQHNTTTILIEYVYKNHSEYKKLISDSESEVL